MTLAAAHPDRIIATASREERTGTVFIDWSQNHSARSTATPYTLRSKPAPTVVVSRDSGELCSDFPSYPLTRYSPAWRMMVTFSFCLSLNAGSPYESASRKRCAKLSPRMQRGRRPPPMEDGIDAENEVTQLLSLPRSMLFIPDGMSGYLRMEGEEARFRAITFARHSDLVKCWLRYFDLYHESVITQNANPLSPHDSPTAEDYSLQLQYRFVALAAGTAKILFESSCAGYYVQAYALCRHLLETWVRIVYVVARPEMAERWFHTKPHDLSFVPPKDSTMHTEIGKSPKTQHLKGTLEMVKHNIGRLDDMAHPSPYTLEQTAKDSGVGIKIGATYNPKLAVGTLHEGAGGFRIILDVWASIVPQSDEWHQELRVVTAEQRHATANEPEI